MFARPPTTHVTQRTIAIVIVGLGICLAIAFCRVLVPLFWSQNEVIATTVSTHVELALNVVPVEFAENQLPVWVWRCNFFLVLFQVCFAPAVKGQILPVHSVLGCFAYLFEDSKCNVVTNIVSDRVPHIARQIDCDV